MSQENVEVVRSVYEAWARNDLPGPAPLRRADRIREPAQRGRAGHPSGTGRLQPGSSRHIRALEAWQIELERFIPAGERAAVVVRYRALWRASGVDVEAHESALWTVRDGKVVRYEWFHGPNDALEAVGLRE